MTKAHEQIDQLEREIEHLRARLMLVRKEAEFFKAELMRLIDVPRLDVLRESKTLITWFMDEKDRSAFAALISRTVPDAIHMEVGDR